MKKGEAAQIASLCTRYRSLLELTSTSMISDLNGLHSTMPSSGALL